jgi:hypothetical protein
VKKLLRKSLIVSGMILALVLLIGLAINFFLPTDQISRRMEVELVKATGAEVTIKSAGVQWWPRLGVTLKDCEIRGDGLALAKASGSANELGDYSATLQRFVVQVALGPLLHKEVLVDAIRLKGLDLEAVHKGEFYRLAGADLMVNDLKISMEAAQEAGNSQTGGAKRPVGELIPEDLVLAFEGHAESLTARQLPLMDVKFHGDLDARLLTIESITASLGEGRLESSLEVDYERDPRGFLDFEALAHGVSAGILLVPWAPDLAKNLEADLNGTVRGNCLLGEQEVIHRTLTLNGKLGSGPGMLWARDWLGDIAPYLGQRQDLMDIQFNSLSHTLRLEKGHYMVENLEIEGVDTHWQGTGSLGLNGTIDMGVKVKLPVGFTPELGQWSFLADTLRDQDGRINLDLSLSGKAAKPQVGINLGSFQDAAGSDAGEAVKKGLGGLLDKWKNR